METRTLNASQKTKKTPIGEIPVDWEAVRTNESCIINPPKREISNLSKEMKVSFILMENIREEAQGISSKYEKIFKRSKKRVCIL